MASFAVFNVTAHPLDCVLDSGHRQIWQWSLVAVETRLSARKNTHQSLAGKNSRYREESFHHSSKKLKNSEKMIEIRCIFCILQIKLLIFNKKKTIMWYYGRKKFKIALTTQTFVVVDIFPCGSNIQRWYERSCLRHRRMVKMSNSHSMVLKITADNNTLHWVLKDWLEMMGEEG